MRELLRRPYWSHASRANGTRVVAWRASDHIEHNRFRVSWKLRRRWVAGVSVNPVVEKLDVEKRSPRLIIVEQDPTSPSS